MKKDGLKYALLHSKAAECFHFISGLHLFSLLFLENKIDLRNEKKVLFYYKNNFCCWL